MSQHPNNPQAEQMSDASMLRTLAAQAEAIWPQERPLIEGYDLPDDALVLDIACGPGEITRRVGELLPGAQLTGVDLDEDHLDRARRACADLGGRAHFATSDALDLDLPDDRFHLVLCRHLLQAVPDPDRALAEAARVCRPGGVVHVLAEDYTRMFFHPTRLDTDDFWRRGALALGQQIGTDMRSGRRVYTTLHHLGLVDLHVEYVTVDTLRVPRATFARIWEAWRDGYTDLLAETTELTLDEVRDHWRDMLDCIQNPAGYAVWHVPIISGRLP